VQLSAPCRCSCALSLGAAAPPRPPSCRFRPAQPLSPGASASVRCRARLDLFRSSLPMPRVVATAVFTVAAATVNCSPHPSQAWLDLARASPSARPCANATTSGRAAHPVRLAMPLSIQPRRMYAAEPRPPFRSRASLSLPSIPCLLFSHSRVRSFAASAKRRFTARHRSGVDRGSEPSRTRSRSCQITSSTAACNSTHGSSRSRNSMPPSPASCVLSPMSVRRGVTCSPCPVAPRHQAVTRSQSARGQV